MLPLKVEMFNLDTCPRDCDLIVLETGVGWHVGQLIEDEEYGPMISVPESYLSPERVQIYIKLPNMIELIGNAQRELEEVKRKLNSAIQEELVFKGPISHHRV